MYLLFDEGSKFLRTLFLTRVPKGAGRFLTRRLADLFYIVILFQEKKGVSKGWAEHMGLLYAA